MQSLPKITPSRQSSEGSNETSDRRAKLARYATILVGSFRKDNSSDPEVFARSLIMVLSDYDDDVIEAAIDPRSGLPSKQSFMPTIHEVKAALEAIEEPRRRQRQREKLASEQIAERKLLSDQRDARKKTYEELQAGCHAKGLYIGGEKALAPAFDVTVFCDEHGISKEQWDAIPNAGDYDHWLRSQGLKR